MREGKSQSVFMGHFTGSVRMHFYRFREDPSCHLLDGEADFTTLVVLTKRDILSVLRSFGLVRNVFISGSVELRCLVSGSVASLAFRGVFLLGLRAYPTARLGRQLTSCLLSLHTFFGIGERHFALFFRGLC